MRDEIVWMALGIALASPTVRQRLALSCRPESLQGHARGLLEAMGKERQDVVLALHHLGIDVQHSTRGWEAVIAALESGCQAQYKEYVQHRIRAASAYMKPEEFFAWLRTLDEVVPPAVVEDDQKTA